MIAILSLLVLVSFICLVIGLFSPKVFSILLKSPTRKKIFLVFGGGSFVLFFLIGLIAPPIEIEDEKINPSEPEVVEEVVEIAAVEAKETVVEDEIVKIEEPVIEEVSEPTISEESITLYSNLFNELKGLQTEYERLYTNLGGNNPDLSLEENLNNAGRYGDIINKIQVVKDKIPERETGVNSLERNLNFDIAIYAGYLINMRPEKDGIGGLDLVQEYAISSEKTLTEINSN